MKGLPLKLKGRLYSAFVHSVRLYNSKVWTINETEMKALVGRNGPNEEIGWGSSEECG